MGNLDHQKIYVIAAMLRIAGLRRIASRLWAIMLVLLVGCNDSKSPSAASGIKESVEPRPSVTLRVLVVNEPDLAEAINRLRGEWAERSNVELNAISKAWRDVNVDKNLDADLIVFPSRYLGELCARGRLRPVRPNVLESEEFNAADIFPLVRQQLMQWGGQVMTLPLGVQLARADGDIGPAMQLLARAAPTAVSKDRLGVLFDSETMVPRITEPAYVEALTQLATKTEGEDSTRTDAAPPIPVYGYADRLAAVTTSSRNAASAFKLLAWLATVETSSQLASAGDGAAPVRRSLATSTAWYDTSLPPNERAELGQTLEAALSGEECLLIPRIPGVDEYMAALDEAVKAAVSGGVAPQDALEQAAGRWEQITDAHDRDAQRKAYLQHLRISEP